MKNSRVLRKLGERNPLVVLLDRFCLNIRVAHSTRTHWLLDTRARHWIIGKNSAHPTLSWILDSIVERWICLVHAGSIGCWHTECFDGITYCAAIRRDALAATRLESSPAGLRSVEHYLVLGGLWDTNTWRHARRANPRAALRVPRWRVVQIVTNMLRVVSAVALGRGKLGALDRQDRFQFALVTNAVKRGHDLIRQLLDNQLVVGVQTVRIGFLGVKNLTRNLARRTCTRRISYARLF